MRTLLCCLILLTPSLPVLAEEKAPIDNEARQERRDQLQRFRKKWPKSHELSLDAIRVCLKVGAMNWCEAHLDDAARKKTYAAARGAGGKALGRAVEMKLLAQTNVDHWTALASKSGSYDGPLDAAQCDRLAAELMALDAPTSPEDASRPGR